MSSHSFCYKFEELPLWHEPDAKGIEFRAGFVDGCAEIDFDHTGDWSIYSIEIDVLSLAPYAERKRRIFLCDDDQIFKLISAYLHGPDRERVEDEIAEQLAEINSDENRRETMAEYRREG